MGSPVRQQPWRLQASVETADRLSRRIAVRAAPIHAAWEPRPGVRVTESRLLRCARNDLV